MRRLRYAIRCPRVPGLIARGITWFADAVYRAVTYAFALSAAITFTIYVTAGIVRQAAGL
jgi:hypothetical protein